MSPELLFLFALFLGGAVTGLWPECGPGSGWAALLFVAVLPPLGIVLASSFC
jgi:hypothetical protein